MYSVKLDDDLFFSGSYAKIGSVDGGINIELLPPMIGSVPQLSYKYIDGKWIFDETRFREIMDSSLLVIKKSLITKSKEDLASYLSAHPLISSCHNGIEASYTITQEKQTLMISQYASYQIEKAIDPNATIKWNESGKSCEYWTEEEFIQLISECKAVVYPLISKQQNIEEIIMDCTSQLQLDSIVIDYGSDEPILPDNIAEDETISDMIAEVEAYYEKLRIEEEKAAEEERLRLEQEALDNVVSDIPSDMIELIPSDMNTETLSDI